MIQGYPPGTLLAALGTRGDILCHGHGDMQPGDEALHAALGPQGADGRQGPAQQQGESDDPPANSRAADPPAF
ncbi:MAG: hypothetical protein VKO64_03295 [Candidatus Sericytochromatia bacterium]|nr:hypothetical protein [Candidatus Sericytochromatia bacterium]